MALKHNNLTFCPTTRPTAVMGSGTLGSRIALMLASSGGEVRLYDPNADQLEVARRYVEADPMSTINDTNPKISSGRGKPLLPKH
jgi:3-hydroxyacyl-CoA dehydrogenase